MGSRDVKKLHYSIRDMLDTKRKASILKNVFKNRVGYDLNLEAPNTFNEKIMWLKLYYQDPLITECSDKFALKRYVSRTIGNQYTVPTITHYKDASEIDFDSLPDRFVLKVNWSSGYNIVVTDKSSIDKGKIIKKLNSWIKPDRNSYYQFFNWGYKHMKPVIYAEKYIEQVGNQVYDYKFFMCNGEFEYMFIATDRLDGKLTYTFFDKDFNYLPLTYGNKPNANPLPQKPKNYDKMIELAKKLAKPFPFVRVDFYETNDNNIYVGEMTFYSGGGILPFNPSAWDQELGKKIVLPNKLITDKEDMIFKINYYKKKIKLKVKSKLHSLRRKILHKQQIAGRKYINLLGLRIPYETHIENTKNIDKKYISLLGVEFCFKKGENLGPGVNVINYEYKENPPLQAYLMEKEITPEIKRIHCEQKAYKQLGYFPNLKNPRSFNEKIIWLALNYKNPEIAIAADKGKAKEYIGSKIGYDYLIPLIGIYDDVNDIDYKSLPNQFVAKLNDGWGADNVLVVKDKNKINSDRFKAVLSSWLYPWNNYYYQNMCIIDEKMEKPTIVIEEYVEQKDVESLDDFKFYCCNGEPRFALVVADRGTDHQSRSFVDMEWNVLPFTRRGKIASLNPKKPNNLSKMIELSRILSKGFPLVRVDFYEVDNKVYVGELTFTPGMFLRFKPKEWDFKLGEFLDLSSYMEKKL